MELTGCLKGFGISSRVSNKALGTGILFMQVADFLARSIAVHYRCILLCTTLQDGALACFMRLYEARNMKCKVAFGLAALIVSLQSTANAGEVVVAVASNFTATLEQIARQFETSTDHEVTIVSGPTGRHYAQIVNGAPYDVFLAADSETPARLAAQGLSQGDPVIYAQGRLALWSHEPDMVDGEGAVLRSSTFRNLAIANPRLAPYGQAAIEVLQGLG